jgi:soluble lytic murein transglycosylase-like protein
MNRLLIGASIGVVLFLTSYRESLPSSETLDLSDLNARLEKAERQASLLSSSMKEVELRYLREVYPIEQALLKRAVDPRMASLAAWAIVKEAESREVSPALIAAIMQVENPWLIPDTVSFAGAVGLMQIMPLHEGMRGCEGKMTDGPTSVCYGVDILRQYLGEALDNAIRTALLRYNGCKNTPGCEVYAEQVMRRVN